MLHGAIHDMHVQEAVRERVQVTDNGARVKILMLEMWRRLCMFVLPWTSLDFLTATVWLSICLGIQLRCSRNLLTRC